MKKFLMIAFIFYGFNLCFTAFAQAISIVVPKKCLTDKNSLALFMQDSFGNECVGMCQLSEQHVDKRISQEELYIKNEQHFESLAGSIEISHASKKVKENEVLLHFELHADMKILKVLIIKDNLLEDNPFDVLCITTETNQDPILEEDEFADLMDHIDDIDTTLIAEESPVAHMGLFSKYKLYVELYVLMQYHTVKRNLLNLVSWLK